LNLGKNTWNYENPGGSLNRSGVQNGTIDIPNLVPMIDTGAVEQSIAINDVKNLTKGNFSQSFKQKRASITYYVFVPSLAFVHD
jgi:hypothetical protein